MGATIGFNFSSRKVEAISINEEDEENEKEEIDKLTLIASMVYNKLRA